MCLRGGGGRDAAGRGGRRRPARADARPPRRRRTAGAGARLGGVLRAAHRGRPGRVRPAPADRVPGRARRTAAWRPTRARSSSTSAAGPGPSGSAIAQRLERGAARCGRRPRRGRLRSAERHDGGGPRGRPVRRPAGGPARPGRPARGERAVRAHRRDPADATRGAAARAPRRPRRGSRRPRPAPSRRVRRPGMAPTRRHPAHRDQPGPGGGTAAACADAGLRPTTLSRDESTLVEAVAPPSHRAPDHRFRSAAPDLAQ